MQKSQHLRAFWKMRLHTDLAIFLREAEIEAPKIVSNRKSFCEIGESALRSTRKKESVRGQSAQNDMRRPLESPARTESAAADDAEDATYRLERGSERQEKPFSKFLPGSPTASLLGLAGRWNGAARLHIAPPPMKSKTKPPGDCSPGGFNFSQSKSSKAYSALGASAAAAASSACFLERSSPVS